MLSLFWMICFITNALRFVKNHIFAIPLFSLFVCYVVLSSYCFFRLNPSVLHFYSLVSISPTFYGHLFSNIFHRKITNANLSRERLCKIVSYKKATHKKLVKSTPQLQLSCILFIEVIFFISYVSSKSCFYFLFHLILVSFYLLRGHSNHTRHFFFFGGGGIVTVTPKHNTLGERGQQNFTSKILPNVTWGFFSEWRK